MTVQTNDLFLSLPLFFFPSSQNAHLNKQDKSTNTLSVQEQVHSEASTKRQAKVSSNRQNRQEIHTQTYDSFFVQRPVLKHQSTYTEMNADNFSSPKRRSVSSETTINNLNKNFCFLGGQIDHSEHFFCVGNNGQLNASQSFLQTNSGLLGKHQTNVNGQTVASCETPANSQDPLLSTISVQTDLDYLDEALASSENCAEHLKTDHLENLLEFSDIQTQTYWNSNDNFTQTDFSLFDIENLF